MHAPRPVLVFDGDCGFCTTSAGLLERRVRGSSRFAVLPWQRLDLDAYGLTEGQCTEAVQWVAADGRVSSAQDAIARCLLAGAPWARLVGALLLAPGVNAVAGVVYRWVAANRYRLPGGTPACAVTPHPPR
ncbi:thiol-disulfide oxidoreductase DCC family protein [Phycicoccus flavus]|uniref:thiol-disulfide oxidoreductase DCC family protein n=1 Tax=Phycicoccus flavus TaxID=2502783 RepID=UPI000FEB913A|nr:DUF393 domain-containing protein [Phycicoccus flavus]NHA70097.1 DUF393 domain-containing protein [Phycicoccus flavus]